MYQPWHTNSDHTYTRYHNTNTDTHSMTNRIQHEPHEPVFIPARPTHEYRREHNIREHNRNTTKSHYHTATHEHGRVRDSRGKTHTRTARDYIHTYMHTIPHTRVTQDTRIRSIRVWPLARSTGIQIRCTDMSRAHESPESQLNKPQP